MIDYIYIFSKKENIQDWQTLNPRLIPHYKARNKQPYKLTLRMRGLSAEVNQYGELKIKGSFHKYCLGNNTEPLTLETLKKGILKLCKYLNVEPSSLFFRNIEFGLNIFLSFPVVEILQSTIYCLGRQFNDMDSTLPKLGKTNGTAQISDYTIKLYDKYRQTTEDKKTFSNMLRYEVHGNNIKYCRKLGIQTMQDLSNASFENLTQEMTKILKQCILVPFGMDRVVYLNAKQQTNYLRYRDFEHWEDLTYTKRQTENRGLKTMLKKLGGDYINEIIKYISEPQKPLTVFQRKQGANLLPNWVQNVYNFDEVNTYDAVYQNTPTNQIGDEVKCYNPQLCGKREIIAFSNNDKGLRIEIKNPQKTQHSKTQKSHQIKSWYFTKKVYTQKAQKQVLKSVVDCWIFERSPNLQKTALIKTIQKNRCCKQCGAIIQNRNDRAEYCSKQCSNKYNNRLRDWRTIIKQAEKKQVYLLVTSMTEEPNTQESIKLSVNEIGNLDIKDFRIQDIKLTDERTEV